MKIRGTLLAAGLLASPVLLVEGAGCGRPVTTVDVVEAGTGAVDGACTWLEGLTTNGTVISICAAIEEVVLIASVIAPLLKLEAIDAGPCTPLPNTSVCATKTELGVGIQAVLLRRRALLSLDGGPL